MKQVIFNVGGALSTYIEANGKKIIVDLGKNSEFSPTNDFLRPYFKKNYSQNIDGKYELDQLIISHPHNDHISDIKNFDEHFYATLVTTPNDNEGMPADEKLNWDLITNPSDDYVTYLRENILPGRNPPLKSSNPTNLFIYYIKPSDCESSIDLEKNNYSNNVSLCTYIRINGYKVLMPGDLMKDGMKYLIDTDSGYRNRIKEGVDFLITPHHGLKSSFSTKLFKKMKNNKTKRLHIVSEKTSSSDTNRIVDSRYSTSDYCEGQNNLSSSASKVYQRKTSNGHIYINYEGTSPEVKILTTDELMTEF